MAKSVFLSFRYSDIAWRNDLLQFFQAYGGPVQATPAFVVDRVAEAEEAAIKESIRKAMIGCVGLICVVGDDSHNSRWVSHEIGNANALGIPAVAARHPQSRGGLPNPYKGMSEVEWSADVIAKLVTLWSGK